MARFTLTIDFDDPLVESEGVEYAKMAASGAVFAMRNTQCKLESVTLTDTEDHVPRWQGGVNWLEWCESDEANDERTYRV